jgi:3',5'-cyclic AMP phosphodiesterase CpdA
MKHLFLFVFLFAVLTYSCKKEIETLPLTTSAATVDKQTADMNKEYKIAVVSDIHYMSPSLFESDGQNGAAFQQYLMQDPKILQYSPQIFNVVKQSLIDQKPDLILMPGDLTKDGEVLSHNEFAEILNEIQTALPETKIYVVPGNHDINNPDAKMFIGDVSSPAQQMSKEGFKTLYRNYGYNSVNQDASSLSYLAKPFNKVWVLGIDANKYDDNDLYPDVSGAIKQGTMDWIKSVYVQAHNEGATIIPIMHHNLVEHFSGQASLDPGFTVDNWETVANELINAGMNVIFTGHYHANDITTYKYNGQELVDIETGSLVNPPLPYRIIRMKNKNLDVNTMYATLPGDFNGMNFTQYSTMYVTELFSQRFAYFLAPLMGVDPENVPKDLTMLFAYSYMAHYAGDEQMPVDIRKGIAQVSKTPGASNLAALLNTLWSDINTKDNFVPITLQNRP